MVEPIASGNSWRLYLGNCVEVMAGLPPESVDMIFADPPYFLSTGKKGIMRPGTTPACDDKGTWDRSNGIENEFSFNEAWIAVSKRILKPTGTIWISGTYHNIFTCGYILRLQGWYILNDIIWYKPDAMPNLRASRFCASHETLIWARRDSKSKYYFNYEAMKFNRFENDLFKRDGKQMRSVWAIPAVPERERHYGRHPTQKPEALLERIITASCPEDGLVLDPFCGSGTTGAAAIRLGRQFIGIDLTEEYLKGIAVPRLEATRVVPKLF